MHDLQRWETFYVILGSSAGALIGLQFVAMTLIAARPTSARGARAFTTPTVVHFVTALVLSVLASAPWRNLGQLGVAWGAIGCAGVVYGFIVGRNMRRQDVHETALYDWVLHLVLPALGYVVLVVASTVTRKYPDLASWSAAVAALLLVLVGVRSSWGVVCYHATDAGAQS